MGKKFTSNRKLDNLPVGSQVKFDGSLATWTKYEKGWLTTSSSWPAPWDANTMRAFNVNRPFEILRTGE